MPTSHTKLSIYNLALDMVGEIAVASDTVDTAEVRWLNRNWVHYREVALRANLWNFSFELHSLSSDGSYTANARWLYRYAWPNNALRFLAPTEYGKRGYPPIPYEVIGDYIYCDWPQPLLVMFVMNESDPGNWDPLFAHYLAMTLAEGMANRWVRKKSYLDGIKAMKAEAHETASSVGAIESGIEEPAVHDIITARELGN